MCLRRSKIEITAKCLNAFDAHCSFKFIITSVVLDIRDRLLPMAWWGGESFFGGIIGTSAYQCAPFSPEKKNPALVSRNWNII